VTGKWIKSGDVSHRRTSREDQYYGLVAAAGAVAGRQSLA